MSKKNVTSKEKDLYEGETEVETLLHNMHMVRELNKSHYPKHDSWKDEPFI